jgi:hypothetical protein
MIKVQGPNNKELLIPDQNFGGPISYDSHHIPSAKIWDLIGTYMAREQQVPTAELIATAEEAEIFRWDQHRMLVHTPTPRKTDALLSGSVYWRQERQRVRPLIERFKVVIARIESELSPTVVQELHSVCGQHGLWPVGMNDGRIYYTAEPDRVFEEFGSKDWVRIAVMLKRPGGSFVEVTL